MPLRVCDLEFFQAICGDIISLDNNHPVESRQSDSSFNSLYSSANNSDISLEKEVRYLKDENYLSTEDLFSFIVERTLDTNPDYYLEMINMDYYHDLA